MPDGATGGGERSSNGSTLGRRCRGAMFPLRDDVPSRTRPVVMLALIGLNLAVFLFQGALGTDALERTLYLYGVIPARFADPAWAAEVGFPSAGSLSLRTLAPFVTSQFLHGDLLHLAGNLWTLWIFGDNVEDRLGARRFGCFYLLCGVAAAAVHVAVNPASTVPAIGASGAISGVMGAYLMSYPRARLVVLVPVLFYPLFLELPATIYLGFWFVLQFSSGAVSLVQAPEAGGVAFWAHVGGFVAGIALLPVFLIGRRLRRVSRDEFVLERPWIDRRG